MFKWNDPEPSRETRVRRGIVVDLAIVLTPRLPPRPLPANEQSEAT